VCVPSANVISAMFFVVSWAQRRAVATWPF
jgi:hypothetical protein